MDASAGGGDRTADAANRRSHPLVRRCPRLGGPVPFRYCLASETGRPCFKVIDCWWETLDVVRFLKDHLTEAEFERLAAARPASKAASLVSLAEESKRRPA